MPDYPQPLPVPSPTPSPIPVGAVQIGAINDAVGGATIVPANGISPSFYVYEDFLEVCKPEVGGYVVWFGDNMITYQSAASFTAHFPQS